ncbi:MAG: amidohydrolase [Balneolaceae bacterium]
MMKKTVTAVCLMFMLAGSLAAQAISDHKNLAIEKAGAFSQEINRCSVTLWDLSETALREEQSADYLQQILQEHGFSIETGVAGMPTAFVGTYGSGEPVIGILAEYDALPGVGNAPVPYRQEREDGVSAGHGCGHNLFAAGSVYGAIAATQVLEEQGLDGTVKIFGTPAEETLVGKVYMAKAGVFDDLDAVVHWHPGTSTSVQNTSSLAMNNFEVEFFGQAAHGAIDPWNGRSALDAAELMIHGVNQMREHVRPSARIHYVIQNGGEVPNVVPEYTKLWFFVRDDSRELAESNYERVLKIAEASALATETEHEVYLTTGVHEMLLNRTLIEAMDKNMRAIGPPKFTEEEQEFARAMQTNLGKEPAGFSTEIEDLADELLPPSGGSTDVAEVSHLVPTVGFGIASAPVDVPWHSWATAASHNTSGGKKSAVIAAKVIAMSSVELILNKDLLQKAWEEFENRTGGDPYTSPIPLDQDPTLPGGVSGN